MMNTMVRPMIAMTAVQPIINKMPDSAIYALTSMYRINSLQLELAHRKETGKSLHDPRESSQIVREIGISFGNMRHHLQQLSTLFTESCSHLERVCDVCLEELIP